MKVIKQSVFDQWQIEDKSVQLIATSPPYYSLRRYSIPDVIIGGDKNCKHEWEKHEKKPAGGSGKKSIIGGNQDDFSNMRDGSYFSNFCIHCNAWQGQYGLEPDYKLYVEHTRLWVKEAWRVLKDDGVFFLNIADSYSTQSGGMAQGEYGKLGAQLGDSVGIIKQPKINNYQSKCQLLIPHRVAMALIDDGWILRNTIIWHKPNGMPESCQDRLSKKYEYIFMFVKNQRYYFNLDAVREKYKEYPSEVQHPCSARDRIMGGNLKGKNPGDVWSINTQPSPEKHFAMYPEKLVERMILCSTKAGDVVLDPFAGSATTLRVADRLNRIGQGIDLGYQDIQTRRLANIQKELCYETHVDLPEIIKQLKGIQLGYVSTRDGD